MFRASVKKNTVPFHPDARDHPAAWPDVCTVFREKRP